MKKKFSLKQRKLILWVTVFIIGVFLFISQIFITKERAKDPNFTVFPTQQTKIILEEASERKRESEKLYEKKEEELLEGIDKEAEELQNELIKEENGEE